MPGIEQEEETPPPRPPVATEALRDMIVEKVKENRVTLIAGDTGCGKSSMVPQFLLEGNLEPIMCTQPRRFAVVAIAQMVAEARKCQLGEEVGYHIGHSNMSNLNSKRSKIVFKTPGVVLKQLRDKGIAALNYKVIILDEVHERSVESDLVLALVKKFLMKKNDLRLVLMSATADIARYKEYFRDIGWGERVEMLAIPSSPYTPIFQRKVLYLEQIADILKLDSESLSTKYCSGEDADADASLNPNVYKIIHELLLHIHLNDPEIEKSILVFLPTYYALEEQYICLLPLTSFLEVHILHRSIDTDQALQTMNVSKSCRKVILATHIAESSVTIPGVAYVIDSCRSLQAYWDPIRKSDSARLVWASKSQTEQRKGRTGRTCDGQIYRLVTGSFYNSLDDHEHPAILRLSLREQVLMVCCAESRAMNDPHAVLQKVPDPPNSDVIQAALDSLVQIHALVKPTSTRGRYEPTFYGCLLNSLPLSFDASVLALKFGEVGFLHEGILLGIMLDIQPLPILQPFGSQALCKIFRDNYFYEDSNLNIGKKETTLIGNLCAFEFWQRMFKDKYRLEYLKNVANTQQPTVSHPFISKHEEVWCASHNLLPAALHHISEIYDDVMSTLHRFRPSFLVEINRPRYLQPAEFHHSCFVYELLKPEDMNPLLLEAENSHLDSQRVCAATPYVSPTDFEVTLTVVVLKALITEMKTQLADDKVVSRRERASGYVQQTFDSDMCLSFVRGSCTRGDTCPFSHSSCAPKQVCKFFLTLQDCKNGSSCSFSHDRGSLMPSFASGICSQEDKATSVCYTRLLPAGGDGHIVLMNDKNLQLSCKICHYYDPRKIVACTPGLHTIESDSVTDGMIILQNVADPCHLIFGGQHKLPVSWATVQRVIWLADFDSDESMNEKVLLQKFFEYIAIKTLSEIFSKLQVVLIMNNSKFVHLQAERLARECFYFLGESFMFDERTLGWFSDTPSYPNGMQVSAPVAYIFNMHPPTGVQFGDYPAELRRATIEDVKETSSSSLFAWPMLQPRFFWIEHTVLNILRHYVQPLQAVAQGNTLLNSCSFVSRFKLSLGALVDGETAYRIGVQLSNLADNLMELNAGLTQGSEYIDQAIPYLEAGVRLLGNEQMGLFLQSFVSFLKQTREMMGTANTALVFGARACSTIGLNLQQRHPTAQRGIEERGVRRGASLTEMVTIRNQEDAKAVIKQFESCGDLVIADVEPDLGKEEAKAIYDTFVTSGAYDLIKDSPVLQDLLQDDAESDWLVV